MNEEQNDFQEESVNEIEPNDQVQESEFLLEEMDHEFAVVRNQMQMVIDECGKLLIGQEEIVELLLIGLLCEGHILIEGVPGVAKTLVAKTFAKTISSSFSRIQFTPDLMPADILGTSIFNPKDGEFSFKKGPIFSNLVLIDEINRSPAKTQSALFEVMEEKQITYDGITYPMDFPYMVIATQNPVEQEGTYRLPEAQLDRFLMKIVIGYPTIQEEIEILHKFKTTVGKIDMDIISPVLDVIHIKLAQEKSKDIGISEDIMSYIVNIINETRNHRDIYLGASPRASLTLLKTSKIVAMLRGRTFVIPDDVQYLVPHVLGHRIIINPEAEINGKTPTTILQQIIQQIEVPR